MARKRFPAIPAVIRGAGGPIKVKIVKRPHTDIVDAWGTWEMSTRTIHLARHAPPALKWKVLFHELVHSAIDDAGVGNLLTPEGEEALADAISTARLQELRGKLGMSD